MGFEKVAAQVRHLIEDADSPVPNAIRTFGVRPAMKVERLDQRIKQAEKKVEILCGQDPVA